MGCSLRSAFLAFNRQIVKYSANQSSLHLRGGKQSFFKILITRLKTSPSRPLPRDQLFCSWVLLTLLAIAGAFLSPTKVGGHLSEAVSSGNQSRSDAVGIHVESNGISNFGKSL